jgi:FKBP-type peptidyl-prolyl cis-trans isomerase
LLKSHDFTVSRFTFLTIFAMKKFLTFLLILIIPIMTAACTNSSDSDSGDGSDDSAAIQDVTELTINDVEVGTGDVAEDGNVLEVHYVGTLLDGTKFDSSRDRGQTFSFTLGSGMVISGWDEGMKGMAVGGVRELTIPADMAYGDRAIGSIPAGSTLFFEVELVGIE